MKLSTKQAEYIQRANKLINLKIGAKGSGKTFVDTAYMIPHRIMERKGKDGLIFIIGVTKETIERNVLKLLRKHYGDLVGEINTRNVCRMFGEDVYCLGAEKVNQITKLQGSTAKYIYGDEVVRWHEEVWITMLAMLRTETSCFDGACNPESPTHYIKTFIDSEENQQDLYLQKYIIDDNPFYPKEKLEALKRQYAGTVYYSRYILGEWTKAEGAIYAIFTDNKPRYISNDVEPGCYIQIGVDFGGNNSGHAFTATEISRDNKRLHVLKSDWIKATGINPTQLDDIFIKFVKTIQGRYPKMIIKSVYCDSAEQVLINGFRTRLKTENINIPIYNALKGSILNRIQLTLRLLALDRILFTTDCKSLVEGLEQAVYDDNEERLDNGTSNIDSLDSFEYSFESVGKQLSL